MAAARAPPFELPKNYFKPVNPVITVVIIFGLFICVQAMALKPDLLPKLGPLGCLLQLVAEKYPEEILYFFKICMWIHTTEGLIGFLLAGLYHGLTLGTSLKWTLSSFVHGMLSLKWLIWPKLDDA
jgi:hypothetical protein